MYIFCILRRRNKQRVSRLLYADDSSLTWPSAICWLAPIWSAEARVISVPGRNVISDVIPPCCGCGCDCGRCTEGKIQRRYIWQYSSYIHRPVVKSRNKLTAVSPQLFLWSTYFVICHCLKATHCQHQDLPHANRDHYHCNTRCFPPHTRSILLWLLFSHSFQFQCITYFTWKRTVPSHFAKLTKRTVSCRMQFVHSKRKTTEECNR